MGDRLQVGHITVQGLERVAVSPVLCEVDVYYAIKKDTKQWIVRIEEVQAL